MERGEEGKRGDRRMSLDKYKGDELKKFIVKLVSEHPEGVTVPYILSVLCKACGISKSDRQYNILRQRVYRAVKSLERNNFVKVERANSSRILILKPLCKCAKHVINLKHCNEAKLKLKLGNKKEEILNTDSNGLGIKQGLRVRCQKLAILWKEFDEELRRLVIDSFKMYLQDCKETVILFENIEDGSWLATRYLETIRFGKRKTRKRVREFKKIFEVTAKRFRWGVMITLTVDPKKVESIWDARYVAQREFNRFMTWLKKFLKERDKKYGVERKRVYLRIIEYQRNGRVHYHVLVFGCRWIKHETEVFEKYWRLGFVDIKRLVVRNGRWVFLDKPDDYDEKAQKVGRKRGVMRHDPVVYFYFNVGGGIDSLIEEEEEEEEEELIEEEEEEGGGGGGGGGSKKKKKRKRKRGGGGGGVDEDDLFNLAMHWVLNTRFYTVSKLLKEWLKEELGYTTIKYDLHFGGYEVVDWEFRLCAYEFEVEGILWYLEREGLLVWGS